MRRRDIILAAMAATVASPAASQEEQPARRETLLRPIEPQNALERTLVAAYGNPALRAAFRRQLVESQVALVLASAAADAPPRELPLPNQARACLIFTSAARLDSVLGPATPRAVLSGRDALERMRGKYVVLNYRLEPMVTLEPEDVENFLAIPDSARPAE